MKKTSIETKRKKKEIQIETEEKMKKSFEAFFAERNLLWFTVGDVLTSRHHLPTAQTHTQLPTTLQQAQYLQIHTPKIKSMWIQTPHTHICHGWHPRVLGGGGVLVLLSRLNGGQAWQACGLIHATRLFTTIQGERSAVTSAQPATPTWRVCVRACVSEALWRRVLFTLLSVSFHMENEEAPLIYCSIYSEMNRKSRVSAHNLTQLKTSCSYYFTIMSKEKDLYFSLFWPFVHTLPAVPTSKNCFSKTPTQVDENKT